MFKTRTWAEVEYLVVQLKRWSKDFAWELHGQMMHDTTMYLREESFFTSLESYIGKIHASVLAHVQVGFLEI